MLDSASYYFNSLLNEIEGKDRFLEQNIYASLSDVEEKSGNLRQSLDYFRKYSKFLTSIQSEKEIAIISQMQNKYDYQLLKNRNNELVIERQRIVLLIIILGIVIISILFFLHRKSKLNKLLLTEIEQTVSQLREMSKGYDEKQNSFRMILLQHFDILKKVALLDGYLNSEDKKHGDKLIKRINGIVYGKDELDWQVLYSTMNDLYDSFFEKLKRKYPQLDENEFRICCLSYAGFSNTEVSIIMKLSLNTVQMKRTSIRKKLGIQQIGGNIENFLIENIGK